MRRQKWLIDKVEWDVLIVLDACRFDVFKRLYGNRFNVEPVISAGTCTPEWFCRTWQGRRKDTIYVSGNPTITSRPITLIGFYIDAPFIFYRVYDCWNIGWKKVGYAWTVNPHYVCEFALSVLKAYPDKKVVVHLLQPHTPYPTVPELARYFTPDLRNADKPFWEALKNGEIPLDLVRRGYEDNLKWAMDAVFKMLARLRG
ncbi:MAG: hypothetical protein DRP01_08865, partial [Archaeoglobales archaeon]